MDESMDIDDQKLARWRHEFIVDIETAKLAKIESGQTQDRGVSEATTATLQNIPQSRESTATIRAVSEFSHAPQDPTDAMDIDEPEATLNTEPDPPSLVVATDFGTTFSSIAFAFRDGEHLPTVKMIMNYPNDPGAFQGRPGLQVPTESWYPNASQLAEMSPDRNSSHSDNADPDDTGEEDLYGTSDMENEPRSHDHTEEPVGNDGASSPSGHHTRDFVWGYGIQNEIAPDKDPKQFDRVARSKLLLDGSKHTKQVRDDLEPVIKRLKRRRIIRTNLDLITDYLTRLFEHAKQELLRSYGYSQLPPIEHVLCVPVLWKSQALRKMQIAFEAAIEQSQFGTMENLFLVSEPEAAAAYVLDKTKSVNVGEAFLILDAGGGTVDATTYIVSQESPLRLSKELVDPEGCLNGSSYLNEGFRQHLLQRLDGETYLNRDGFTIEGIVDDLVVEWFENKSKRTMDVTDPNMGTLKVMVPGLREDSGKRFMRNRMLVSRADFKAIFMPHFLAIEQLMKKQLEDAKKARHEVKKVIMVGGFSTSRSLRNHLKQQLLKLSRAWGYEIKVIDIAYSGEPETAVAHGAVLRALDKEKGPDRIPQCSYGFLRTEPFKEWKEHKGVKPSVDELDGQKYVKNTIDWLVKKGVAIKYHEEHIIDAYHLFPAWRRIFKCEEVLYVSDTSNESHYTKGHKKNKGFKSQALDVSPLADIIETGSEVVGKIIADMSFLVKENHIQLIKADPNLEVKAHYKIEFELAMIINGRNLRYEARWPRGGGGHVHGSGQICIAAAFQPGTN